MQNKTQWALTIVTEQTVAVPEGTTEYSSSLQVCRLQNAKCKRLKHVRYGDKFCQYSFTLLYTAKP